jgi:acyl carrier protein
MFERVRKLLAEQLNVKEENIKLETKIAEDLGADSLDMVETLMAVEDEFGISIPDEKASEMKTVKDLVDYLEANKDSIKK